MESTCFTFTLFLPALLISLPDWGKRVYIFSYGHLYLEHFTTDIFYCFRSQHWNEFRPLFKPLFTDRKRILQTSQALRYQEQSILCALFISNYKKVFYIAPACRHGTFKFDVCRIWKSVFKLKRIRRKRSREFLLPDKKLSFICFTDGNMSLESIRNGWSCNQKAGRGNTRGKYKTSLIDK